MSNITTAQISEIRKLVQSTNRPYIGLTDLELLDEIDHQEPVVQDCIKFAQRVGLDEKQENYESMGGLYFAFLRYNQLTDELAQRLTEQTR